MNKRKILHIPIISNYTSKYYRFLMENFNVQLHDFLIIYNQKKEINNFMHTSKKNVIYENNTYNLNKILHDKKYEKIIIHGFFYTKTFLLFSSVNKRILNKTYWVIWGGDLYYYIQNRGNPMIDRYEIFRKKAIKNFGGIITFIRGDYELAKKYYRIKAKYYYAFYPNIILYSYLDKLSEISKNKNAVIIQVGNSADPTNKHVEIFNELERFKNKNIRIVCPLSYGDMKYAQAVIQEGNRIFGNKFKPLTKFLDADEYGKILSYVDVAIFNHDRQQALGNILSLLYLGKKIYIKNTITPWELFKEKNIRVFNTYNLDKESFESFAHMDDEDRENNKKIVKEEFSEEKCAYYWGKIFEE